MILVFKTNASEHLDQQLVSSLFCKERLRTWNFDFEDCDNIFRVESYGISADEIIEKLATIGIDASEID